MEVKVQSWYSQENASQFLNEWLQSGLNRRIIIQFVEVQGLFIVCL